MAATSALNPNAPIFVPSAFRTVEDFSDQWWDLVQSSPWFRDYWLQDCFTGPRLDDSATKLGGGGGTDLVALGWLKWRKPRCGAEMPRFSEKAPKKIVRMRVNPRPIHQPR